MVYVTRSQMGEEVVVEAGSDVAAVDSEYLLVPCRALAGAPSFVDDVWEGPDLF